MPLWKNTDEAASAPQFTVDTATGNTGVQAYNVEPVGTWGVDSNEASLKNVNGHAGWVLRTVGEGGRAGRVIEETLVAMGSMDSDGSDDTVYPDAIITITSQPSSVSANTGNTVTFSVVATSTPTVALTYAWEVSTDSGANWTTATGAPYSDETTATLVVDDNTGLDGYQYRAVVSATGADSVTSSAATLTEI
jgi:hypothetical protein